MENVNVDKKESMEKLEMYQNLLSCAMTDEKLQQEITSNPTNLTHFLNELVDLSDGGMSLSITMELMDALGQRFIYDSEATKVFSDEDMLTLYKDMFKEWETADKRNILSDPTFVGIQSAFNAACRNGQVEAYRYLISNFPIEVYDIDGLNIVMALDNNAIELLRLIVNNADRDNYGFTGRLSGIIHPKIREKFREKQYTLPIDLAAELSKFRLLGTD